MKKNEIMVAALALIYIMVFGRIGTALAACESKVESIAAADVGKSTLTLVALEPPADAAVNKETVLAIDLEYRVAKFAPKTFRLVTAVMDGPTRSVSIDIEGKDSRVPIEAAAGQVRMCLPLAELYDEDQERVQWPLELQFMLLRIDDAGRDAVRVASTRKVKLNAEIPAGALERQAMAPPPEYDDALGAAFDFFEGRSARYKACIQRFPAMQSTLTKAFRSWEARHAADIEFVSGIKFAAIKRIAGGREDVAAQAFDRTRDMALKSYVQMKADDLKFGCESMLEQISVADDITNVMVGDHLATLRKWHAKEQK